MNKYLNIINRHLKKYSEIYFLVFGIILPIFAPLLNYLGMKIWLIVSFIIVIINCCLLLIVKTVHIWYRYIIIPVILLFLGYAIFVYYYNPNPEIFNLTDGYLLKFEDTFKNGNFDNNPQYNWNIRKYGFENGTSSGKFPNGITLKSGVEPESKNTFYQDLSKFNGEVILLAKFYLNNKSSIGFDFIKKVEPGTRGSSYQSCGATTFNGMNGYKYIISNSLNYIYSYNGNKKDYSESQKGKLSEGFYYVLAKISKGTISCFIQKEGNKSYDSIISNVGLDMNELGGPKLIKYSTSDELKPYILDFRIYSK